MKTLRLIVPFLVLITLQAFPQASITITKPQLSYHNDTLTISFDINGCAQKDLFNIDPLISSADGSKIPAASLKGDMGDSIRCGDNKQIIWSLAADQFRINGDVEVQIIAEQVFIGEAVDKAEAEEEAKVGTDLEIRASKEEEIRAGKEEEIRASKEEEIRAGEEDTDKPLTLPPPSYSRGNIMASSLVFPGLGQKKASRKGGHLLLGVVGYGSLAASGYFIYDYNKKYNEYLDSETRTESDRLFTDSEKSYKMARYFIYGAAGVWAVNLIWSAVVPAGPRDGFSAGATANKLKGLNLYARWTF